MKEKILELRQLGWSYKKIAAEVGCAKSTVAYHLSDQVKKLAKLRTQKRRSKHPYIKKLENFFYKDHSPSPKKRTACNTRSLIKDKIKRFHNGQNDMTHNKSTFSVDDVLEKFGENPKCYLTGKDIDISQPRSYQFDHKIPRSRGGDNSLDNLGIASSKANRSKSDMTPDEYINLCKQVLEHAGYLVSKPMNGIEPSL